MLHDGLGPARLVLALAALGVLAALWRRRLTIYHVAYGSALAVLLPVFEDFGTYANQLLDAYVLAVVVVGILWADARELTPHPGAMRGFTVVCVLIATAVCYRDSLSELRIREAARELVGRGHTAELRAAVERRVRPGDRVLSENPYVADILGERPVVLDPYLLPRIAASHPTWLTDFVRRLDAREFDTIFLLHRPELAPGYWANKFWYTTIDLGWPIARAITRNYRLTGRAAAWWDYSVTRRVESLWIYRPRPAERSAG